MEIYKISENLFIHLKADIPKRINTGNQPLCYEIPGCNPPEQFFVYQKISPFRRNIFMGKIWLVEVL